MFNHIPQARTCFTLALLALTISLVGCVANQPRSGNALGATDGYSSQDVVAVLLPKSGRYAGAAEAVRDGILAAQSVDGQARRPQVRFYDSSDPASVPRLLLQAAADGATLAIGPLQKESVNALAASSTLPIPTLALNRATTDIAPKNLYQFALSPEDEAAEVANKAWEKGYRTALVLSPEGSWGDRISSGFRRDWVSLGGRIVASRVYDPNAGNNAETISGLFSQAGGTADFMFLVTTAAKARKLWPQVRANGGAGLPVYTTSHIYSGSFDPDADLGLVGLYFVDIPWLLAPNAADPLSRERLQVSLSGIKGKYTRLYAMGIDAYALAPRVTWMTDRPGAYLDGKTGRLSLDTRRHVRRELTLARLDGVGPARMTDAGTAEGTGTATMPFADPAQAPRIAALRP